MPRENRAFLQRAVRCLPVEIVHQRIPGIPELGPYGEETNVSPVWTNEQEATVEVQRVLNDLDHRDDP